MPAKLLESKIMKHILDIAVNNYKTGKWHPSDGYLLSSQYTAKNGWFYQYEVVNDSRYNPPVFAKVWAWKPKTSKLRTADYYIYRSLVDIKKDSLVGIGS